MDETMTIDQLIKLLEEKKSLISEYLQITKAQSQVIKTNEYEELLELIAKKETIIEQTNEINTKIKDIPMVNGNRVNTLLKSINELVEETMAIDQENEIQMKELRDEMAALLKNARKNKESHSLYRGKNISIEGVLLDKKK